MALNTPHGWNMHPLQEVVPCPSCGLPMEATKFSHPVDCVTCNVPELLGLDDELDKVLTTAVARITDLRIEYAHDNA